MPIYPRSHRVGGGGGTDTGDTSESLAECLTWVEYYIYVSYPPRGSGHYVMKDGKLRGTGRYSITLADTALS